MKSLTQPTFSFIRIVLKTLVVGLFFLYAPVGADEINYYEQEVIQRDIRKTFNILIQSWQEELYFDMYDFGQQNSRKIITKESFAQRMVELKWKPGVGKKKVTIKKIKLLYRNYGLIFCDIEYHHKSIAKRHFKKEEVFPAILENNQWKFDLTQIIRIPY